jgi:hypothetical protein
VQADQIELETQNRVTNNYNQFASAISSLQYQASRRGIKSSSNAVTNNYEKSIENLGEDNQKMIRGSNEQQRQLREEYAKQKAALEKQKNKGLLGSVLGAVGGVVGGVAGFMLGGPMGAAVGAQVGSSAGGAMGNMGEAFL